MTIVFCYFMAKELSSKELEYTFIYLSFCVIYVIVRFPKVKDTNISEKI